MDAVKFLEERKRMFKEGSLMPCLDGDIGYNSEKAVKIVEEWSAVHPRKTRQSALLEQYPMQNALMVFRYFVLDGLILVFLVLWMVIIMLIVILVDTNSGCKKFYEDYFAYNEKSGWITIPDYYNNVYVKEVA